MIDLKLEVIIETANTLEALSCRDIEGITSAGKKHLYHVKQEAQKIIKNIDRLIKGDLNHE